MAWRAQFQKLILACFSQTTNLCCFGNSEKLAINNALISTSLAVNGLLHLANFVIADLGQILLQVLVKVLQSYLLQNIIQENIEINYFDWCMVTITKNFVGYIFSQAHVSFL